MDNRGYKPFSERTYAREMLAGLEDISRRADLGDKERDFLSRALPAALRRVQRTSSGRTHSNKPQPPGEVIGSQPGGDVVVDHELSEWCACNDCTLWRSIAPRCGKPDWRPGERPHCNLPRGHKGFCSHERAWVAALAPKP